MVNHNSTADVGVAEGSAAMSGHAGLHALGRFCDVLGLGELLSGAYGPIGEREPVCDRGKALVQALLVFAGGGEACSDIEVLRSEEALFGSVPSASTLYRVARGVDAERLGALGAAAAHARRRVWPQIEATRGEVVIDIDASLMEVHSENKAGAAAHYKGGFGFHPMYAFADCTGECLAVLLRPGNAAANSITDQTAVLDAAVEALPADAACGHRLGDDASQARRRVRVRADSAGCNGFIAACVERNVGYSVVARRTPEFEAAIAKAVTRPKLWQPAETQRRPKHQRRQSHRRRRSRRRGAQAADLTRFVDAEHRPEPDARLITRREPLHQGAPEHSNTPDPRPCDGTSGTPPPASCDTPERAPSHCPRTAPPPQPYSTPASASTCSSEHTPPLPRTPRTPRRPNTPQRAPTQAPQPENPPLSPHNAPDNPTHPARHRHTPASRPKTHENTLTPPNQQFSCTIRARARSEITRDQTLRMRSSWAVPAPRELTKVGGVARLHQLQRRLGACAHVNDRDNT